MAMSDEAMFAPPQGITIEAVNGMLAERLAQKHGKASYYAPSSRCRRRSARYNLLNCMFSKATSITATMMMAAM